MKIKIKKRLLRYSITIIDNFLKIRIMKNKNITLNEIGLFLSCLLMVLAIIYIRSN